MERIGTIFDREGEIIYTQKPFKKVGTHHGKFHADEVMATAILQEIFDTQVVRTRNPNILDELDLVYDVGGGEFDHHQVEKVYREDGTPFAACGLIWRSFGKDVIEQHDPALKDTEANSIFRHIDGTLIEGIDAVDNGLKTGEAVIPTMNVSSIISGFNPPWDSEKSEDQAFVEAVEFAGSVLRNTLNQQLSIVRAREKVEDAYKKRERDEVLVLDTYCPWTQTLQKIDEKKEVLFVVYPNQDGYVMQTVRKQDGTMEARKDLPKAWAGKRDTELGEIIGIDDAIFCHTGRFIAGAKSYDSIMKMADIAVNEPSGTAVGRLFSAFKKLFS